jgi:Predicted integral membrane protein
MNVLASYADFVSAIRTILLALAIVVTAFCVFDWAVRTRRISPFNGLARFFRGNIDPLMQPVERVVIRSGGSPVNAPWWTLAAVIVGGILLITLLGMIGNIIGQVMFGLSSPAMIPKLLISWSFSILRLALLVRVLSSWLPVSPYSKWVRWSYVLTEWMIRPLQRVIPLVGRMDLSPLVAWFLLNILQSALGIP